MFNPIKLTIKSEILPLIILLITVASSFYFFNNFPDQVAAHWNLAGEVNGYSSSFFAAFFAPAVMLVLYLLFLFIPYLDPKKERYYQFASVYNIFKTIIIAFFSAIYFIAGFNALGYNLPVETLVPGLVGLLLVIIGNYMGEIKSNWFVGIRTPWTLSNERVWDKTHHFGRKVFILAGLLMMLNPLLPINFRMAFLVFTIIIIILGTIVYSYLAYIIEEKRQEKK